MKPNEEIMNFLKENPTFYLATVDGYLPRVRPLGFAMWYNGHLCLAIGKHKAAYKQLLDNTNLELCAANDRGEWLRVQGTANFDNTPEAQEAAFKVMPQLEDLYNEETGNKLGIVYLDHLSAKLFSMSGTVKDIMNY
ncbi:MAG TPA: pyridoxamine 5'-phosphate oxidase family protein [Candidatus Gemmiger avistercoris]|uniref:Pyridoxamine 5'-phosphate oxidase family protein n=1 Tax=Candidatus Gemmiger avistercoris TaxID=2838606 RepID=A0A9D2JQ65_9FIRM|nr:pyridoxamine 5'-phosphate oxidase family protein [uncultured Subdoligranulum sp.]HIZ62708.1 pyridoxamine 5'-phosphate oxidase family protein [Candidatus Gemmiger avistercoris]